ncbi:ubiquitin-related domain-containing protein [Aspergillus taichungensis]|uniref:Ubiquitin-related domain-containing protein n=1 Tax=Aspergillus taichungensis TaxID=482145 RepID=A0A2J5I7I1_9EURO|nr:ubiquitin-related domain-containing protein [Aspergillus taichungensis]
MASNDQPQSDPSKDDPVPAVAVSQEPQPPQSQQQPPPPQQLLQPQESQQQQQQQQPQTLPPTESNVNSHPSNPDQVSHENTASTTGTNPGTGDDTQTPVATAQRTGGDAPIESNEAKSATSGVQSSSPASDASLKEAEVEDSGPSLLITLLLITGSRHPLRIDGSYLRKRSVNVENDDPFAMSVYTLKELIWRGWRQDWETRPSSPSAIRLISFGKLLDDNAPLSDSKFNRDAPNVVHMTVKPQEIVDEEDAKGAKTTGYTRERETSERSPSCRCVIQ